MEQEYKPGQKLTTPREVMNALLKGCTLDQGFKPFHMRDDGKFYFVGENEPIAVNLSSQYLDDTWIFNPKTEKTESDVRSEIILWMIEEIGRTIHDEVDRKHIQTTLWAANQLREKIFAPSYSELKDAVKRFDEAVTRI